MLSSSRSQNYRFYATMLSSITNDPVSSWGYQSENTTNASGVTFNVKFMGYVPVNNSISNLSTSEKDALVKLCVTTVVTCDLTDQFKDALREESLGPYISVAELEVFLNVANFTITFFHKEDGTFLLGRYMNNTTSYYKTVIIDGEHYLGLVMGIRSPRTQRECNVIKLGSKKAHDELIEKLKSVHNEERCPVSKLESRLKSTQEYDYKIPMLSCYHGSISEKEAYSRLKRSGEFLCRDSLSEGKGVYTLSWRNNEDRFFSRKMENASIAFAQRYQTADVATKHVVVRPHY